MFDSTGLEKKLKLIEMARMVIARLERVSVDSLWARRASGYKASLVKFLEKEEKMQAREDDYIYLDFLLRKCFELLEKAAREIPDPQRRV